MSSDLSVTYIVSATHDCFVRFLTAAKVKERDSVVLAAAAVTLKDKNAKAKL